MTAAARWRAIDGLDDDAGTSWDDLARRAGIELPISAPFDGFHGDLERDVALYWPAMPPGRRHPAPAR